MRKLCLSFSLFFLLCGLVSCAKKPVLYPNAKLQQVGQDAARKDISECMRLAKEYGVKAKQGEKVAKSAAKDAVVGAAAGAAVGAIFGNFGRGLATGAAGGAAGGAARGAVNSGDPDAVYKRFVNKCLREKGYEPIGWK